MKCLNVQLFFFLQEESCRRGGGGGGGEGELHHLHKKHYYLFKLFSLARQSRREEPTLPSTGPPKVPRPFRKGKAIPKFQKSVCGRDLSLFNATRRRLICREETNG